MEKFASCVLPRLTTSTLTISTTPPPSLSLPWRCPFKAFMDTGLARVTTGARIFAVLKGVVDGGVNVPHSMKRFPGYNRDKGEMDSETLRERIFAGHVAEYQKMLIREEPEKYQEVYSQYIVKGVKPGEVEDMWANCHASIRAEQGQLKMGIISPCRAKTMKGLFNSLFSVLYFTCELSLISTPWQSS